MRDSWFRGSARPSALVVVGGLVLAFGGGVPAGVAGASAAPSSWSVIDRPAQRKSDYVAGPIVDRGRLWTLELFHGRAARLQARSIRTGRIVSTVRVRVPLSKGAHAVDVSDTDEPSGPQLAISGTRGAVTGTWCARYVEDERGGGATCEGPRTFFARFSTRTGKTHDGKLTAQPRRLLAGTRPLEVVSRRGRSSALRDIATRRTVRTIPSTAIEVQGAGHFMAWKTGAKTSGWTTMTIADQLTGATRYRLSYRHLQRAAGGGTGENAPLVYDARLAANGTVDLNILGGRRLRPFTVDTHGHTHRLHVDFRGSYEFDVQRRGDRVVLQGNINAGDPREPCVRTSSWLTDVAGRVGNDFHSVPVSPGRELSSPTFVSPRAILWTERTEHALPPRIRAVPDTRQLPLTRAERPRCVART